MQKRLVSDMAKKSNNLDPINDILNNYVKLVSKDADNAAEETAKATANHLKHTSPHLSGSYAKGWRADKKYGAWVVHNKTDYQLTHLLENGHDVVAWGKKVGHVKAYPHIKEAEDLAKDYFEQLLKEKIENDH